jgi:hypothetical protein
MIFIDVKIKHTEIGYMEKYRMLGYANSTQCFSEIAWAPLLPSLHSRRMQGVPRLARSSHRRMPTWGGRSAGVPLCPCMITCDKKISVQTSPASLVQFFTLPGVSQLSGIVRCRA